MLSAYPACFIKEENGYSVVFPDLNHLATCGRTLDVATAMAVDCLAGYLRWLEEDGEAAPAASPLEDVDASGVLRELGISTGQAFVNMVVVDVDEYARTHFKESATKMVTIPAWLNTAALEQDIDFSQVLQEALKERLHVS